MSKFYDRTLDSFSDETITRTSKAETWHGWYAALDVGSVRWASDPDFATAAGTREDAVRLCAQKIRNDARGIGKYAPHSILSGYDFHFRLAKHWSEKEKGNS